MNRKVLFLWCSLFACAFCACNKEVEEKWAQEEADLAEWIKENKPNALFDNDIYIEKIGPRYEEKIQPEAGDHVLVNFVCSFLDGVVEQVSYMEGQTSHNPLYRSKYKEGGPELWPSDYWGNMGVGHLRENECANIYIPSRKLGLQDFKSREYMIELVQVIDTDLKTYQEKLMGGYMKKRFCNKVDTFSVEYNKKDYYVMYHVDNEGTGGAINVASVSTHYDEYYFLQEDKHKECVRDKIKTGWDRNKFSEMFKSVKKGGKITVVMPYRIMYGEQYYMDGNKQYIAPPGSVLMYNIRIDP